MIAFRVGPSDILDGDLRMNEPNKKSGLSGRTRLSRAGHSDAFYVLAGFVLLATILSSIFMVQAWGVGGTILRLGGIIGLLALVYYCVRNRDTLKTKAHHAHSNYQAVAQKRSVSRTGSIKGSFPGRVTFLGKNSLLECNRAVLKDPLIYVVAGSGYDPEKYDSSLIVASLHVAPVDTESAAPLPYWPNYTDANPEQRAVYWNWLSGGRKTLPSEIGYAFIFFYGLERRALVDQEDHELIFDEVMRLRTLNESDPEGPNRSFESYTASFLWLLVTFAPDIVNRKQVQKLAESTRWMDEDNLSSLIGWFASREELLPSWAAFVLARQLPDSQNSVVVTRVQKEFKDLFLKRYTEQFGHGMRLRCSKRKRRHTYQTASNIIEHVSCEALHPLGIRSQFKPMCSLWNQCVEDLRKLSTAVRGQATEKLTPAKWEALPPELREKAEHPLTVNLCDLISECTSEEGHTLIPISRLANMLSLPSRDRLTPKMSRQLTETIEHVGYCIEPDFRLTNQAYK